MKAKKDNLKKAIHDLPETKLEENLWEAIKQKLDVHESNSSLSKAINDLPEETLEENLWEGIERKVIRRRWLDFFNPMSHSPYKIAAAAAVLIGLSFLMNNLFTKKSFEQVIYSVEWSDENPVNIIKYSDAHSQIAENINHYCLKLPATCEQEAFTDLNNQLEDVQKEKQKLIETIEKTENQNLAKYLNRLENKELEIEKKILNLFKEN